jgi:hypothetical protein
MIWPAVSEVVKMPTIIGSIARPERVGDMLPTTCR